MERLTIKLDDKNYIPIALCTTCRDGQVDDLDGCEEYCDSCDGECSKCALQKCFNKLAEYEDLEEQGLLLRLPCKVGDTIYVNGFLGVGEAEEYKVIRVDYHSNLSMGRSEFYVEALLLSDPRNSIGFYDKEIGKTVFLTKAEAEQKLRKVD